MFKLRSDGFLWIPQHVPDHKAVDMTDDVTNNLGGRLFTKDG